MSLSAAFATCKNLVSSNSLLTPLIEQMFDRLEGCQSSTDTQNSTLTMRLPS